MAVERNYNTWSSHLRWPGDPTFPDIGVTATLDDPAFPHCVTIPNHNVVAALYWIEQDEQPGEYVRAIVGTMFETSLMIWTTDANVAFELRMRFG